MALASLSHPLLSGEEWEGAPRGAPPWTADMDDMLQLILRHRRFNFEEVRRAERAKRARRVRAATWEG
eukprot:scaffold314555_cov33-Tisochrysis_lutea.AAC.1